MIEVKFLKDSASLKGYTFIEGFPGIGLVGPMAISYIIDKMNMKYIGYLISDSFPPLVSIHHSEPMPSVRIYSSDKDKIVTIFAEFAIPIEMIAELANVVYQFIQKNGISSVYSIGGVPSDQEEEELSVPFIIASNQTLMKSGLTAGLKPIEEGVATGVSALILVKAVMDKGQDTCIMVPVRQNIIDPTTAEMAIQSLNKLINLNIDITDLDKEAKMVQAKIKELIAKHRESHESLKKVGQVDDEGPSMYA